MLMFCAAHPGLTAHCHKGGKRRVCGAPPDGGAQQSFTPTKAENPASPTRSPPAANAVVFKLMRRLAAAPPM